MKVLYECHNTRKDEMSFSWYKLKNYNQKKPILQVSVPRPSMIRGTIEIGLRFSFTASLYTKKPAQLNSLAWWLEPKQFTPNLGNERYQLLWDQYQISCHFKLKLNCSNHDILPRLHNNTPLPLKSNHLVGRLKCIPMPSIQHSSISPYFIIHIDGNQFQLSTLPRLFSSTPYYSATNSDFTKYSIQSST